MPHRALASVAVPLALVVAVTAQCSVEFKGATRKFGGCQTDLTAGISVYWTVDEATDEVHTLFQGKPETGGYVSFGWGAQNMNGANVGIAYVKDGVASIRDYRMTGETSESVQPASNQGWTSSAAEISADGTVTGYFVRPLGSDMSLGSTEALWAVGPPVSSATTLQDHSRDGRGHGSIDLSQQVVPAVVAPIPLEDAETEAKGVSTTNTTESDAGTVKTPKSGPVETPKSGTLEKPKSGLSTNDKWKLHGLLMIGAWLVLVPLATIAMRFFSSKYPVVAFKTHGVLMTIAVLVTIGSIILAFVTGNHQEVAHLAIGVVVVVFAILQVAAGVARPGKDTTSRVVFIRMHRILGMLTFTLAVVNIFIGLHVWYAGNIWYILCGVAVGFIILAFVLLNIFVYTPAGKAVTSDGLE
jgi:DOMON domain/Eukaryotic cytochrome b561